MSGSSASESDSEELPLLVPASTSSSLSQSLLLSWSSSPPYDTLHFRASRVIRGLLSLNLTRATSHHIAFGSPLCQTNNFTRCFLRYLGMGINRSSRT